MEKKSPHILIAASGLLGFCLVILTSLKITNTNNLTYIDEAAGVASLCLTLSCVFSFMAIRTKNSKKEIQFEKFADYLFLSSLFCISISVLLVTFNLL